MPEHPDDLQARLTRLYEPTTRRIAEFIGMASRRSEQLITSLLCQAHLAGMAEGINRAQRIYSPSPPTDGSSDSEVGTTPDELATIPQSISPLLLPLPSVGPSGLGGQFNHETSGAD